jgi:hypothetical protein
VERNGYGGQVRMPAMVEKIEIESSVGIGRE